MPLTIYGYLLGLNDCNHPEKNPCTYPAYCNDEQGVVVCDCPLGMSGNGRKMGSGCFPIYIALGNLLNTPGITNSDYHILFLLQSYPIEAIQIKRFFDGAMVCSDGVQCLYRR